MNIDSILWLFTGFLLFIAIVHFIISVCASDKRKIELEYLYYEVIIITSVMMLFFGFYILGGGVQQ